MPECTECGGSYRLNDGCDPRESGRCDPCEVETLEAENASLRSCLTASNLACKAARDDIGGLRESGDAGQYDKRPVEFQLDNAITNADALLAGQPDTQRPLTFRQLQEEQAPWVAHNFPGREAYYPLLGAIEELGELAHAHLKNIQGIRGTPEEHHAAKIDAVADTITFLADYCTASGIDLQDAMERRGPR